MTVVKTLIEHFADRSKLHVSVREVRDLLVGHRFAVKDRILFVGVKIDIGVLRGFLHQYIEEPNSGGALMPGDCADIYYNLLGQEIEWKRLVCCKEMLHLLDPIAYRTSTPDHVKEQIEQMALPPGMENLKTDGMRVWGDRLADLQAIAVLFPMAARARLLKPYKEGKLTAENIARLARLPELYVRWVMSDRWGELYQTILRFP